MNPFFFFFAAISLWLWSQTTTRPTAWRLAALVPLIPVFFLDRSGFFLDTTPLPPRIGLILVPLVITGAVIAFTRLGDGLRKQFDPEKLHYFHAVRIIVEAFFLHHLYLNGSVARALTFEGLNFDIVPGVLLPVVGYLHYRRKVIGRKWVITANVLGVISLAWTVVVAVLSVASPYQQFGFDQPTTAILSMPYILLPTLIVPLVFFSHFLVLGIPYPPTPATPHSC